ncbi:MAG: methyltransferase [Prevotella sp.]|nr:methyltransferase [Prevotella sp.]
MANDYFKFRQFTVRQDRCAMKVGTDGTLLGAWARGGCSILDIGTGTGLIALMLAQRFPKSRVIGIDIDSEAVEQARDNVAESPFHNVDIIEADVSDYRDSVYEAIVSNPPYFEDSLECPDGQRTMARHTSALSYHNLMESAWQLLADGGELSLVIPFDCKARLESEAALIGFFKSRECAVRTTPKKQPRRYLLAFRKHPVELELSEGVIETAPNVRSAWYHELTKDFYL